ncbi:FecR family protein [Haloferula sargassicola]|uniref:FecR protein domain-containing protein n=1 Tax=Haloferula sargassicola TaxID=490096 RepID=A0ABP9UQF8_9BACT
MKPLLVLVSLAVAATAAPLSSAKITQAINDVRVLGGSDARAASVGETVGGSSSVQTGRKSRAELMFTDQTLTRLGQNSVFSFRNGSRDVELKQGSILLQVPKNAGGATIRTATVTAAITGTTSMFEYSPGQSVKLLTLEGTQKLYINGSKTPVLVPAGQMIVMRPDGRVVPQPVTIDIARLLATSPLAGKGTFGPLPAASTEAIQNTVAQQKAAKRSGALKPTLSVVRGPRTRLLDDIRTFLPTHDPYIDYERPDVPGQ